MIELFPETPLMRGTIAADAFLQRGCTTFRDAARCLHSLPYRRNTSRSDLLLALHEQRGTCSSKHALLAQLAREAGVQLDLVVGIYEMNGANTPGVGDVLQRHGLESVPEAHCVVKYEGRYLDITWPGRTPALPVFLREEHIEPHQVAGYKIQVHREFLREWCAHRNLPFEEVWTVRELCIAALA